jgi:sarcosine oxidase
VTDPAWRDPPAQEPRPSPAGPVWDAVVVGLGALGSAAAWALARAGARVLGLEQFELGHHRGASHDHARIIRRSYHSPGYVRLAGLAYQAWEELEREAGERLVVTTGGLDLFPAGAAIRPGPYRASLEACGVPYHWLDAAEVMRRWPAFRRTPTSTACGRPTAASSRPPAAPGSCSAWPPASAPPCSTGPR